jgi:transposase
MKKLDTMQIITDALRSSALNDVAAGMSVADAAEKYNVGQSSVRRWMKKGVPQTATAGVAPVDNTAKGPEAPKEPEKQPEAPKEPEATPPAAKTVIDINRDVTYRNGQKIFRKRILLGGKKFKVTQMVKEKMPEDLLDAKADMEKVKEAEKAVIEAAANDLFDGNKNLAAVYVRGTIDEVRDGVKFW